MSDLALMLGDASDGAWHETPDSNRSPGSIVEFDQLIGNDYLMILVTRPAPTVRPPSRMANFSSSSMAIGWIS